MTVGDEADVDLAVTATATVNQAEKPTYSFRHLSEIDARKMRGQWPGTPDPWVIASERNAEVEIWPPHPASASRHRPIRLLCSSQMASDCTEILYIVPAFGRDSAHLLRRLRDMHLMTRAWCQRSQPNVSTRLPERDFTSKPVG
jgi:hypothetical protein